MSKIYDLAVRFYNSSQLDKAAVLAKNLIYTEPFEARSYKLYGAIHQANQDFSYAIGAYQHAFKFDSADSEIPFFIAQCYVQLGRWEPALHWIAIARGRDPHNPQYYALQQAVKQKIT